MTTSNRSAAASGRTAPTPVAPRSSGVDGPQVPPAMLRRATMGAAVGSIVEWFDVAVYAYLAAVIGVMAAALVTLPIVLTAPETAPVRAARTPVGTRAGVPAA